MFTNVRLVSAVFSLSISVCVQNFSKIKSYNRRKHCEVGEQPEASVDVCFKVANSQSAFVFPSPCGSGSSTMEIWSSRASEVGQLDKHLSPKIWSSRASK